MENFNVGKYKLTKNEFYGIDVCPDSLDLGSLTSIPAGFNPTVGGYLDLGSLTSIPAGFNPTVEDYLYLGSLTSIPEGFNKSIYENKKTDIIFFQDKRYCLIDWIFAECISIKRKVIKLKKIGKTEFFYAVTDGNGKWAHGDSAKEAKDDLIYKISNNSDKNNYVNLTLNSVLTLPESIEAYRVITGACSFGTKDFIESNNIENKSYTIQQIIEITKGKYGHDTFKNFFNK